MSKHGPRDTPVIIAAGGNGRRIGGNKPEKLLGGKRLIDHALDIAKRFSNDVAVSLQNETRIELLSNIPLLYDDYPDGGPLSALASALKYGVRKEANHILFICCDMPFLPPDLLERQLAAAEPERVTVPSCNGRLQPASALWPPTAQKSLVSYIQGGNRSMHGFAELIGCDIIDWSAIPFDPFFNINSLDDIAKAQKWISRSLTS